MNARRFRNLTLGLMALLAASDVQVLWAQYGQLGMIPPSVARRYGLTRAWTTQIELDRGRGRVVQVVPHVSWVPRHTVFEVQHDGGVEKFSERRLDSTGNLLGLDKARKEAQDRLFEIKKSAPNPITEPKVAELKIDERIRLQLLATTDLGAVHAIDAETGRTRWVTNVGDYRFATSEAAANDKYVAVLNGTSLYVLNSADGGLAWQRHTVGVPSTGPTLTDTHVFVPMLSGAVESYSLADFGEPMWNYKAAGHTMISAVSTASTIAWPSDAGNIYVCSANPREMRYRLEMKGNAAAPLALMQPDRALAMTVNGYVYCLHQYRREVVWKFATGESSSQSPVAVGDAVYALTDESNLFCISGVDGEERWRVHGIKQFLASGKDRLYCLADGGRLVILDTKSGSRVGSLPAEELDLRVVNTLTDRIYVGTKMGTLQCLHEITAPQPLIHVSSGAAPIKPKKQLKQDVVKPKAGDKDVGDPFGGDEPKDGEKMEKPDGENPFGDEMPKAGDKAGDKDKAKKKEEDNPF